MQIQDTVAVHNCSGNLHSSGDTWCQNLNRIIVIVQTAFCIIEIAEVISSLVELDNQSMSFYMSNPK